MSSIFSPAIANKAYLALAAIITFALVVPFVEIGPFLLFFLLLIFFICLVIYINIFNGLVLLLLLRPVLDIATGQNIMNVGPFSINLAAILGVLTVLFALSAFTAFIKSRANIRSLPLFKQWVVLLGISLISLIYTVDIPVSISEWIRLASIFSLFLIGFLATSSIKNTLSIAKAVIFSAFVPAMFAFYQFFTENGFSISFEDVPNRVFGTFAHPNPFAYFLTIALAMLLFFILKKGNPHRILASLYFIALASLLALTYTRGAWLVLLGIVVIIGILKFRKFFALSLLVLFSAYLLIEPIHTRVDSLLLYGPSSSIHWRIELWNDSINYALEKPLFGYGIGTAEEVILQKRGEEFGSTIPHNDYLRLAIDIGLVGLISYLTLAVSLIAILIKKLKQYFASENDKSVLLLVFVSYTLVIFGASAVDNILEATSLQWAYWALAGSIFGIFASSQKFAPKQGQLSSQ